MEFTLSVVEGLGTPARRPVRRGPRARKGPSVALRTPALPRRNGIDGVLGEYDGNNNLLRKYIYGPGIDQPVCMLPNPASDGIEVAVEDANHPNPYVFAGVRYDIEIGLYYNRARYYNPFTGRYRRRSVLTNLQSLKKRKDHSMNSYAKKGATSRREFLVQTTGALAGASLASAIVARGNVAEQNTIKVALIGCGGRGTGAAANALSTRGPTQMVAMADVFESRLANSLKNLSKQFGKQVNVPPDRQFLGLDAYRSAIDAIAPGGVAVLATPPAFRPIHLEYAVAKGCHVFMEKSFAVDAPGIRRVLKAGKEAQKKNLKIAGGLMSRHYKPLEEAVQHLHDGIIGEVITCWAYREHAPVGFASKSPGMNELAHQIRNYHCFTWLNGSFILDWLIHNIDVCCWCKGAWPVSAQGQGGRQVRSQPDQLFDHYCVEYTFADGTRLLAQGRHIDNCWGFFGDIIHGAKGSAELGEGIPQPRIFKGHRQTPENVIWRYEGPRCDAYQVEHDLLFEAIRQDKPYNETERSAHAAMAGILGRMAAESGQMITWEQAMASDLELAPGLDSYTMDSNPPVKPDAQGRYPIAMPGQTKVL